MEISVFLHHVQQAAKEQDRPLPEALRWIKSLGIDRVEVDGNPVLDTATLKAQLDDAGLGVSSVYAFFDWGRHPEDQKDFRLLRTAQVLGSPLVMPIPGLYASEDPEEKKREDEGFLAGMQRMVAESSACGLTATIEPFDNARSPIATIAGMQRFLDAVPALAVTLDTGNFRFSAEDVLEAQQLFGPRIVHVHLKDRLLSRPDGMPEENGLRAADGAVLWPCAVGDGDLPLPRVIRGLQQARYDGFLSLEHFNVTNWAETIRRSAENVQRMLGNR